MNNQLLSSHIEGFVATTRANAYWKDKHSVYLGCNDVFIHDSGLHSQLDLIGSTDVDQPWRLTGRKMIENDKEVMIREAEIASIETASIYNGQEITFLSIKSPLRTATGKVIGVFGLSYNLNNSTLDDSQLLQILMFAEPSVRNQLTQFLRKKQFQTNNSVNPEFKLSPRESEVLMHLIQGKSAREIGGILFISRRTVENTIARIKDKTNCKSKYDLIYAFLGAE